jgi:two-component system, NtrC family, sensor histidine kinase HydH
MMPPERFLMNRRAVSLAAALLAFAALTAVSVVIFRDMAERRTLESRNAAEQTLSSLFTALRDHEDFGTAIEASEALRRSLIGLRAVAADGGTLFAWGEVPVAVPEGNGGRYIPNPTRGSFVLVLRPQRDAPPPPPRTPADGAAGGERPWSFMRDILRHADLILLEMRQPAYWAARRARQVLFPLVEAALAALVFFVRFLVLRNAEYRRKIEEQKNLVLLGTAAGTLAHEIKNPLLAIRLQSSILERTVTGEGRRELNIINDEVERLTSLTNRIGDVLRDPAGNPVEVEVAGVAREVGRRLCGRDLLAGTDPLPPARVDPERLRSILENLVRNALESGGRAEEVSVEAAEADGGVRIDVLDRGAGIGQGDRDRIFDPFFTTKSRGSGIGLTICRRFAAAAGGSISIENRPGGGCRASLTLPLAEKTAPGGGA